MKRATVITAVLLGGVLSAQAAAPKTHRDLARPHHQHGFVVHRANIGAIAYPVGTPVSIQDIFNASLRIIATKRLRVIRKSDWTDFLTPP